jgi:hypothetical protein
MMTPYPCFARRVKSISEKQHTASEKHYPATASLLCMGLFSAFWFADHPSSPAADRRT